MTLSACSNNAALCCPSACNSMTSHSAVTGNAVPMRTCVMLLPGVRQGSPLDRFHITRRQRALAQQYAVCSREEGVAILQENGPDSDDRRRPAAATRFNKQGGPMPSPSEPHARPAAAAPPQVTGGCREMDVGAAHAAQLPGGLQPEWRRAKLWASSQRLSKGQMTPSTSLRPVFQLHHAAPVSLPSSPVK